MPIPNPTPSQTKPRPEISTARRETVERARKAWISKLIDLSRRNNLLYYRQLKLGTLRLEPGDTDRWPEFLRGESVALKSLVRGMPDEILKEKALAIWRKAQANQEEKGLATLFVAIGMATWKCSDGGRDPEAPVLLLPASLEMKGQGGNSLALRAVGPIQLNLVLPHVLEKEFGVTVPIEQFSDVFQGRDESAEAEVASSFQSLKRLCAAVPSFEIKDEAFLGNFAFQKMAMVKDLEASAEALAASDVIAALAGDSESKAAIGARAQNPDPKEFDKTPPESEFLVLDADSSQQTAIVAILSEQSGVVHGPPGTGKSQTIANLIASLAAKGKRVLFVAEKRAALQVVLKRLEQVGLGKIAIDLHGADVSTKRVMEQVAEALGAVRQARTVDCEALHRKFAERRERLNRHTGNIHQVRKPGGMSVYQLQGRLLHLQNAMHTRTRWRQPEINKIEKAGADAIRDSLREAGGLASLFLRKDASPWNGATLADGPSAQRAIDLVVELHSKSWPEFLDSSSEVVRSSGIRMPATVKEAQSAYQLIADVQSTLQVYTPDLFAADIQWLLRRLEFGRFGGMRATWNLLTNAEYRQARRLAIQYRKNVKASSSTLFAELTEAENQKRLWTERAQRGSLPKLISNFVDCRRKLEIAAKDLTALTAIVMPERAEMLPIEMINGLLESLVNDRLTPMKLPGLYQVEQRLTAGGVSKLVDEIRESQLGAETWVSAFDQCWYSSCLEYAQSEEPALASFNGRTHDDFVREFREFDEARIELAAARVTRAYAERAVAAMDANKDQEFTIRSESEKKRRHRPLRALFADTRNVLTAICPCWMASPLSVSQLLDTSKSFDFVIFDEASQVLSEDAIPAIMRGSHLVVAGDQWQLPPTTFFAADDDDLSDVESNQATEGFESLLDMANSFMPSWYLDWHYRSRDEALISFSNNHIYKNRLVTFPGPSESPAIRHVLVSDIVGEDGQEDSSSAEVNRVVDLVIEHATKRPSESLGVIAMGIRHADRVQRALDQRLQREPHLSHFFDANADERFFVKNLERVQGDERDAIIMTVGYGKDRGGNLPFRFGPLLTVGGQKRLNVAVTRARTSMTVVSSFSHMEMDAAKVRAGTGVEMLRSYLEYAASNGKRLGDASAAEFPMNSFEAEVYDVLQSKGIPLISQFGSSRYRIDFVAQHPKQKGRFVLAIECDGASYHSSPTARDRDRLRQQQLQNLGWKFHRIWSTDWFMRKHEEVARAVTAFERAVAAADDAGDDFEKSARESTVDIKVRQSSALRARAARPAVGLRDSIGDYSESELIEMVKWIDSDGQLRTHEETIDLLMPELGLHRRGPRIEAALRAAIEKWRARPA